LFNITIADVYIEDLQIVNSTLYILGFSGLITTYNSTTGQQNISIVGIQTGSEALGVLSSGSIVSPNAEGTQINIYNIVEYSSHSSHTSSHHTSSSHHSSHTSVPSHVSHTSSHHSSHTSIPSHTVPITSQSSKIPKADNLIPIIVGSATGGVAITAAAVGFICIYFHRCKRQKRKSLKPIEIDTTVQPTLIIVTDNSANSGSNYSSANTTSYNNPNYNNSANNRSNYSSASYNNPNYNNYNNGSYKNYTNTTVASNTDPNNSTGKNGNAGFRKSGNGTGFSYTGGNYINNNNSVSRNSGNSGYL